MAKETVSLRGAGPSVRFSNGTLLDVPGASGTAVQLTPATAGLRSATLPADIDTSVEFEAALREAGIREQETIHLDVESTPASLRGAAPDDTVRLTPHVAPGDEAPRVVLYQDESGGLSWHFAAATTLTAEERARMAARGFRAPEAAAFTIPLRTVAADDARLGNAPRGAFRGALTKIGRKIFKVLILPAVSSLIERPLEAIVGSVERRVRPRTIWRLTPDNYRKPPVEGFSDWSSLDGKRTLLVVHGILSSVQGMLWRLPPSAMERWQAAYEGRVIAFNHQSLSQSPEDNARDFLEAVRAARPAGRFTFDILCHSRGGIVSREMVERGRTIVPATNCDFTKVFFVASPNRGSILGNADHMVDMIDVFTNIITNFPDGPTLYSIELVLALVKLVAHGLQAGLPGVEAMSPASTAIKTLNAATAASPARYAAASADYRPTAGEANGWLLDRFSEQAVARVFAEGGSPVTNDLVVPYEGVFAANGHPSFPIQSPLLFAPSDDVCHVDFFARDETIRAIDHHFDLDGRAGGVRGSTDVEELEIAHPADRRLRGKIVGETDAVRRPSSAGAHAAASTVERVPAIDFHELMVEGQASDLVVRLDDLQPAGTTSTIQLAFEAGAMSVELVVDLSAPGFEIVGERHQTLTVGRLHNAGVEKVTFKLIAGHPGSAPLVRQIIATFWLANSCVGTVSHFTNVVPKHYTGQFLPDGRSVVDPIRVPSRPRESPDLVIYVRRLGGDDRSYDVSVRCNIRYEEYETRTFGDLIVTDGLDKYMSDAIDPQFRGFPDPKLPDAQYDPALARWNASFVTHLKDLGKRLWTLLPQGFRDEYLRLATGEQPPRAITVHSDEMVLPWEVIVPSGMIAGKYVELPALGVGHVMGRWKPGLAARPQPQTLSVKRFLIVCPVYTADGLPSSQREAQELEKLFACGDRLQPASRAALDTVLGSADTQVLHFSGHGDYGASTNVDLSALRLENGDSISAMGLASNRLGHEGHPILFINACTVGRGGIVLGRSGGFAANCLDAGWSGVIAPYWPVYDPKAFAFSLEFYRKLRLGRSVGEALQELRSSGADDPTALSYSYFGDPWARVTAV